MSQTALNSKFLKAIAIAHWTFPFTYLLALIALYNLTLSTALEICFSFYYAGQSLFAIYLGFMIYQVRPWAWQLFCFHSLILALQQIFIGITYAESHIPAVPILVGVSFIVISLWLVRMELRVPYFSPKIAWWESDPRYKITIPVTLQPVENDDQIMKGQIMDISAYGCFIKTTVHVEIDQFVKLHFNLFGEQFTCKGLIVWHTETSVTHPKGIGIKFKINDKNLIAKLKTQVKKIRKLSKKYYDLRKEEKASQFEEKLAAITENQKVK